VPKVPEVFLLGKAFLGIVDWIRFVVEVRDLHYPRVRKSVVEKTSSVVPQQIKQYIQREVAAESFFNRLLVPI
jgi:hypothetical protein